MASIKEIKKPVEQNIDAFEKYFKDNLKSKVALLDIITKYIIKRKGKQIRPLFVFLTAGMLGKINESTNRAAALIELMHTATLIHDDVVDDSHMRRGAFSINALWKNKVAVLVGDYLLSKGLLISLENKEFEILEIITKSVKQMSEGELLQLEKARKLDIDENVYFDIITKKTAVLIAACLATGAISVGADKQTVNEMWQAGIYAGIAFQIKDDLLDYQSTNLIGKPVGNDIKERKLTLPLIYALKNASTNEKKHIIKLLKKKNKPDKIVSEIHSFALEKGGIIYSEKIMVEYKNKALKIIEQYENNEIKKSLMQLIDFLINRKK